MQAIIFEDVETLSLATVAEPVIVDAGDVIVQVHAAGICGSDLHPYLGRERGLDRGTIMGHELVGRIVEVGGDVRTFRRGDRVVAPFTTSCGACPACESGLTSRCVRGQLFGWVENGRGLHGAQAELVRVPLADTTLVRVPDALLDDGLALLAGDVLSTALFAAELADVRAGDAVAIVGCGPVGLLAVRAALARGAREVFALDAVASRLAIAERFGATPVRIGDADGIGEADGIGDAGVGSGAAGGTGPTRAADDAIAFGARREIGDADAITFVRARTGGLGVDRVIEAVGSAQATRSAADLLRPGGTVAAVGVHTELHLALSPGEIYDRNLTYAAGRCPARRMLPAALELAQRDAGLLGELISHRLPLSAGVEAYRRLAAREEGWAKVVLVSSPSDAEPILQNGAW
jgi:threonine dehydrogenase-like Zn-dependent dehydrogenase